MLLEIIGLPTDSLGPLTIHGTLKGGDGGVEAARVAFRKALQKFQVEEAERALVIFHGDSTRRETVPGFALRLSMYGHCLYAPAQVCDEIINQAVNSFGRLLRPEKNQHTCLVHMTWHYGTFSDPCTFVHERNVPVMAEA